MPSLDSLANAAKGSMPGLGSNTSGASANPEIESILNTIFNEVVNSVYSPAYSSIDTANKLGNILKTNILESYSRENRTDIFESMYSLVDGIIDPTLKYVIDQIAPEDLPFITHELINNGDLPLAAWVRDKGIKGGGKSKFSHLPTDVDPKQVKNIVDRLKEEPKQQEKDAKSKTGESKPGESVDKSIDGQQQEEQEQKQEEEAPAHLEPNTPIPPNIDLSWAKTDYSVECAKRIDLAAPAAYDAPRIVTESIEYVTQKTKEHFEPSKPTIVTKMETTTSEYLRRILDTKTPHPAIQTAITRVYILIVKRIVGMFSKEINRIILFNILFYKNPANEESLVRTAKLYEFVYQNYDPADYNPSIMGYLFPLKFDEMLTSLIEKPDFSIMSDQKFVLSKKDLQTKNSSGVIGSYVKSAVNLAKKAVDVGSSVKQFSNSAAAASNLVSGAFKAGIPEVFGGGGKQIGGAGRRNAAEITEIMRKQPKFQLDAKSAAPSIVIDNWIISPVMLDILKEYYETALIGMHPPMKPTTGIKSVLGRIMGSPNTESQSTIASSITNGLTGLANNPNMSNIGNAVKNGINSMDPSKLQSMVSNGMNDLDVNKLQSILPPELKGKAAELMKDPSKLQSILPPELKGKAAELMKDPSKLQSMVSNGMNGLDVNKLQSILPPELKGKAAEFMKDPSKLQSLLPESLKDIDLSKIPDGILSDKMKSHIEGVKADPHKMASLAKDTAKNLLKNELAANKGSYYKTAKSLYNQGTNIAKTLQSDPSKAQEIMSGLSTKVDSALPESTTTAATTPVVETSSNAPVPVKGGAGATSLRDEMTGHLIDLTKTIGEIIKTKMEKYVQSVFFDYFLREYAPELMDQKNIRNTINSLLKQKLIVDSINLEYPGADITTKTFSIRKSTVKEKKGNNKKKSTEDTLSIQTLNYIQDQISFGGSKDLSGNEVAGNEVAGNEVAGNEGVTDIKEEVADTKEEVAENKEVAGTKEGVTENKEVAENKQEVTENKQEVTENKQEVTENKDTVEPKDTVESKEEGVTDTKDTVETKEEVVAYTKDVVEPKEDVVETSEDAETNGVIASVRAQITHLYMFLNFYFLKVAIEKPFIKGPREPAFSLIYTSEPYTHPVTSNEYLESSLDEYDAIFGEIRPLLTMDVLKTDINKNIMSAAFKTNTFHSSVKKIKGGTRYERRGQTVKYRRSTRNRKKHRRTTSKWRPRYTSKRRSENKKNYTIKNK